MTAVAKPRAKRLPAWAASAEALRAKWVEFHWSSGFFPALGWSDRILRLFVCASCRCPVLWSAVTDPRSASAVEVAERYADGLCGDAVRIYAECAAASVPWSVGSESAWRCCAIGSLLLRTAQLIGAPAYPDLSEAPAELLAYQSRLLVAVVGPGWTFSPAWRTSDAVALARVMYDARDFSAMPILADAIEDAGCDERALLDEMRSAESVWCRGCRVVDELLGKR